MEIWREGVGAGDRQTLEIFGVEYAFRYCPPGTFWMGGSNAEEKRYDDETRHFVTLTRGFWLLETPVTQAMWKSATGENPSWFSEKGQGFKSVNGLETSDFPAEQINWDDGRAFVEKLRDFAPSGWKFALPTEAQWEYACRAGTETPFSFGGRLNGVEANCDGDWPYGTDEKGPRLERPTTVRSYKPNAWGFYDMHGNVDEWCADWFGDYDCVDATDPTGPSSGVYRILRAAVGTVRPKTVGRPRGDFTTRRPRVTAWGCALR